MTPEQFVYWLQGYLEVADPAQLDAKKTKIIKDHLKTVFKKVTPDRSLQKFCAPTIHMAPQSPTLAPDIDFEKVTKQLEEEFAKNPGLFGPSKLIC